MSKKVTVVTKGPEGTRAFGAWLAERLAAGDFVELNGDLAAGKTCLVQGMALGLGYKGQVTSPTFTLLHLYEGGRLPLYHFDVYRLQTPEELEGLGYEDYFFGDGICVVEWGSLAGAYLPERRISLTMERQGGMPGSGSGEALGGSSGEALGGGAGEASGGGAGEALGSGSGEALGGGAGEALGSCLGDASGTAAECRRITLQVHGEAKSHEKLLQEAETLTSLSLRGVALPQR